VVDSVYLVYFSVNAWLWHGLIFCIYLIVNNWLCIGWLLCIVGYMKYTSFSMSLPVVNCSTRKHFVLGLSNCFESVRSHILKVFEHSIAQTVCGNFTKFTTWVQLGERWTDFEFNRSKVKVTTRQYVVKNVSLKCT